MSDRNAVVATLTADQMLDVMMAVNTLVEQRDAAREEAAQLRQQLAAEASDPITWGGSSGALDEIRRALGHGDGDRGVYRDYEGWLEIEDSHTHEYLGFVAHNARIQIAGDSFVILPPEKDGDA